MASGPGTLAFEYGKAYAILSPPDEVTSLADADAAWESEWQYSGAGTAVAGPGDLDGDGHDDVVLGADYAFSGGVFVVTNFTTGISGLGDADVIPGGASVGRGRGARPGRRHRRRHPAGLAHRLRRLRPARRRRRGGLGAVREVTAAGLGGPPTIRRSTSTVRPAMRRGHEARSCSPPRGLRTRLLRWVQPTGQAGRSGVRGLRGKDPRVRSHRAALDAGESRGVLPREPEIVWEQGRQYSSWMHGLHGMPLRRRVIPDPLA